MYGTHNSQSAVRVRCSGARRFRGTVSWGAVSHVSYIFGEPRLHICGPLGPARESTEVPVGKPASSSIAPRASLAWTWTRFGSCLSTAVGRSNRCGCSSGRFDHSEASLRGWEFDWLFLPSRPPGTWLRCSAGGVLLGLGLRVAAAPPMPRQDLVWLGDVLKHRKSATLPVELQGYYQGPEGARQACDASLQLDRDLRLGLCSIIRTYTFAQYGSSDATLSY